MKTGTHIREIEQETAFLRRLADADRIRRNPRIIHKDRYFHAIAGYLPEDLPECLTGIRA